MSTTPLSFISMSQRMGLSADQFSIFVQQMLYQLRVAIPCIVQTFNPGDGVSTPPTVSVLPAVMDELYQNVGGASQATPIQWKYPWTIPVLIPGGGNFLMTFPIQAGDECLVVFCDMDIQQWRQAGGVNNAQMDKRRHDLSDGVAIMRPHSAAVPIPDYNLGAAELRNLDGTVKITMSGSTITFTGPVVFEDTVTFSGSLAGGDFVNHTHSGVTTGSGTSGPVASE